MKAVQLFERLANGYGLEYKSLDDVYCDVRFVVMMSASGDLHIATYTRDEYSLLFDLVEKHCIRSGTARKLANYMRKQLAEHGHDKHVLDWNGFTYW